MSGGVDARLTGRSSTGDDAQRLRLGRRLGTGCRRARRSVDRGRRERDGPHGGDPERYGSLAHPGDVFSFDIYTQAGGLHAASRRSVLAELPWSV